MWYIDKAMKQTRVFIHGLESSSRGNKGAFFRQRYPGMIIEDFFGSFPERMEKLESLLAEKNDLILVGSSFGGLMAAVYTCLHEEKVKKLVLLAPALHLEPYAPYLNKILPIPIVIYHGLQDDVVPLEAVRTIAERLYVNHEFNAVEDDHSLHSTFATYDWDELLNLRD
jgi:pimeloyl-ACP methyl ester carboxylesterase